MTTSIQKYCFVNTEIQSKKEDRCSDTAALVLYGSKINHLLVTTSEKLQIESEKVTGSILENYGVDEIMWPLNKKGYCSRETLRIRTEMEQSKETYDYLIRNQSKMPGENRRAEAVVKYYLFQLDELKRELPYDAMGCDLTVPLLVMQEFQKKAITEKVMDYLENPDIFSK